MLDQNPLRSLHHILEWGMWLLTVKRIHAQVLGNRETIDEILPHKNYYEICPPPLPGIE